MDEAELDSIGSEDSDAFFERLYDEEEAQELGPPFDAIHLESPRGTHG